jgi:hypothetical protein
MPTVTEPDPAGLRRGNANVHWHMTVPRAVGNVTGESSLFVSKQRAWSGVLAAVDTPAYISLIATGRLTPAKLFNH